MKWTIAAMGITALFATAAAAQDRPAGWQSMPCDAGQFSAVLLSNGDVGYWTNPTCPSSAGGRAGPVAPVVNIVVTPPPQEPPTEPPPLEPQ